MPANGTALSVSKRLWAMAGYSRYSRPGARWTLGFTLPAGQAITSGWNATYSPISRQVAPAGDSGSPSSFTLIGAPAPRRDAGAAGGRT